MNIGIQESSTFTIKIKRNDLILVLNHSLKKTLHNLEVNGLQLPKLDDLLIEFYANT